MTTVSGNGYRPMNLMHRVSGGMHAGIKKALTQGPLGVLFSSAQAEKAIELKLVPLLPLVLAVSCLLYEHGLEQTRTQAHYGPDGSSSQGRRWHDILTKSAVASLIIEHTKSVYPLVGLLYAAYKTGQAPTTMQKLQAAVAIASTLSFGFLGFHFLKHFSLHVLDGEDQDIAKALKHPQLRPWLEGLNRGYYHGDARALGDALMALETLYDEKTLLKANPQLSPLDEKLQGLRTKIAEMKTQAYRSLENIEWVAKDRQNWGLGLIRDVLPASDSPASAVYKGLREVLSESQSGILKLARVLNPWSGFILGGMLLGGLFARGFNRLLNRTHPEWHQEAAQRSLFDYRAPLTAEDVSIARQWNLDSQRDGHLIAFWKSLFNRSDKPQDAQGPPTPHRGELVPPLPSFSGHTQAGLDATTAPASPGQALRQPGTFSAFNSRLAQSSQHA